MVEAVNNKTYDPLTWNNYLIEPADVDLSVLSIEQLEYRLQNISNTLDLSTYLKKNKDRLTDKQYTHFEDKFNKCSRNIFNNNNIFTQYETNKLMKDMIDKNSIYNTGNYHESISRLNQAHLINEEMNKMELDKLFNNGFDTRNMFKGHVLTFEGTRSNEYYNPNKDPLVLKVFDPNNYLGSADTVEEYEPNSFGSLIS